MAAAALLDCAKLRKKQPVARGLQPAGAVCPQRTDNTNHRHAVVCILIAA